MDYSQAEVNSTRKDSKPASKPIVRSQHLRRDVSLRLGRSQARSHLACLHEDGNGDECFTFFVADDRKSVPSDLSKVRPTQVYHGGDRLSPRSWHGTLRDSWADIVDANRKGYGVFVCIQNMDSSGSRRTENFRSIRTCVNDLDHGAPPKPYPRNRQPSFSVRSSVAGRHDYFLATGMDVPQFTAVQSGFADFWGGDKQVKDVARVMRLAGTFHRKTDEPYLVEVIEPTQLVEYTGKQLVDTFGVREQSDNASAGLLLAYANNVFDTLRPQTRYTLEQIRDALTHQQEEADDRDTWISYGHALKRAFGDEGKAVWAEWASNSASFDANDVDYRWNTFRV